MMRPLADVAVVADVDVGVELGAAADARRREGARVDGAERADRDVVLDDDAPELRHRAHHARPAPAPSRSRDARRPPRPRWSRAPRSRRAARAPRSGAMRAARPDDGRRVRARSRSSSSAAIAHVACSCTHDAARRPAALRRARRRPGATRRALRPRAPLLTKRDASSGARSPSPRRAHRHDARSEPVAAPSRASCPPSRPASAPSVSPRKANDAVPGVRHGPGRQGSGGAERARPRDPWGPGQWSRGRRRGRRAERRRRWRSG